MDPSSEFNKIMTQGRRPERFTAQGSNENSVELARNFIKSRLDESRKPGQEKYGVTLAIDLVQGFFDLLNNPVERGKYDNGARLGTVKTLMGMDLDHAYQLKDILGAYDNYLEGTIGEGDNTQTVQERMTIMTINLLLPTQE